jgi:hypothetical protein
MPHVSKGWNSCAASGTRSCCLTCLVWPRTLVASELLSRTSRARAPGPSIFHNENTTQYSPDLLNHIFPEFFFFITKNLQEENC